MVSGREQGAAIERDYWRARLVLALERRAVIEAFRDLTAHAPEAPFAFDPDTHCMMRRRVG